MERISGCSFLIGVAIIICGCFYAVALHNPAGPPPSARIRQRADSIAGWSCGIGAMLAVGIPVLEVSQRLLKRNSQEEK